jgi:hypothetical protein
MLNALTAVGSDRILSVMNMSKRAKALREDFWRLRNEPGAKGTATVNIGFTVQADELDAARELEGLGYIHERGNNVGGWKFGLTQMGADDMATLHELPSETAKDSLVELPDP